MKYYIKTLFFLSCLFSCAFATAQLSRDTAIINISSIDTTDFPVQLLYHQNGATSFVKGNSIAKGRYQWRVPVQGYEKAEIFIRSPYSILMSKGSFMPQPGPSILIGAGKVTNIKADFKDQLNITAVSTDPEIKLFESWSKQERRFNALSWQKIKERADTGLSEKGKQQIEADLAGIRKQLYAAKLAFVKQHPKSFAALAVFDTYYQGLAINEALHTLQSLAPAYKNSQLWVSLHDKLTAGAGANAGSMVPAFSGKDINGNAFHANQLKGKYYLVDFWGSWCNPCRKSHPELKALYEKYHAKGFEIVGIAYESGDAAEQQKAWRKAVNEDGLGWINLLNSADNDLVKQFGVTSYPTKLLIDPDGKIVMRVNESGDEMAQKLKSIFENKQISHDSLMNYLNTLLKDNSSAGREKLLREAAVLRKGHTESDMALAMKIYNVADDTVTAGKLEQQIIQKYPCGIVARDRAYAGIFGKEVQLTLAQKEQAYNKWLKQFPPGNFGADQQGKYNFAAMAFVQEYAKQQNISKVTAYLARIADTSTKTVALCMAGTDFLDHDDTLHAKPLLSEALTLSKQLRSAGNLKTRSSFGAMFYENIVNAYTRLLLKSNDPDGASALLQPLLKDGRFGGMNAEAFTLTMTRTLILKGKKQEAYALLNDFLVRNTGAEKGLALIEPLFLELNPQAKKEDYLNQLAASRNKLMLENIKKEMIAKPAPGFSLTDMDGRQVNLSDYKGKVVVLDFWATWCVPCVKSFPAMQQLINRFKDNNKVAFLFINTWESNPDYKTNVKRLIDEHQYSFTVLYDDKAPDLVVKKFGVESIPAKFVIDQNGDIRFRVTGNNAAGGSEVETLSAMIGLLL